MLVISMLLVALNALPSPGIFGLTPLSTYSVCSKPDSPITILDVVLSPNPIKWGQDISATVHGSLVSHHRYSFRFYNNR